MLNNDISLLEYFNSQIFILVLAQNGESITLILAIGLKNVTHLKELDHIIGQCAVNAFNKDNFEHIVIGALFQPSTLLND